MRHTWWCASMRCSALFFIAVIQASGGERNLGSEQAFGRERRPEGGRDGMGDQREVSFDLGRAARAGDHRGQGGMAEGELQGRRAQGYGETLAYRLDRRNPAHDL